MREPKGAGFTHCFPAPFTKGKIIMAKRGPKPSNVTVYKTGKATVVTFKLEGRKKRKRRKK